MSTLHEGQARSFTSSGVDFAALLAGVRSLKPKCVDCGVALQESVTGVRIRLSDKGKEEKLCRACAVSEIGETLIETLPR